MEGRNVITLEVHGGFVGLTSFKTSDPIILVIKDHDCQEESHYHINFPHMDVLKQDMPKEE